MVFRLFGDCLSLLMHTVECSQRGNVSGEQFISS